MSGPLKAVADSVSEGDTRKVGARKFAARLNARIEVTADMAASYLVELEAIAKEARSDALVARQALTELCAKPRRTREERMLLGQLQRREDAKNKIFKDTIRQIENLKMAPKMEAGKQLPDLFEMLMQPRAKRPGKGEKVGR